MSDARARAQATEWWKSKYISNSHTISFFVCFLSLLPLLKYLYNFNNLYVTLLSLKILKHLPFIQKETAISAVPPILKVAVGLGYIILSTSFSSLWYCLYSLQSSEKGALCWTLSWVVPTFSSKKEECNRRFISNIF